MRTEHRFASNYVTIVSLDFFHTMIDEEARDEIKLGPRPDQLRAGQNTPVTSLTRNGLLAWLPNGTVVHCDWLTQQQEFARRDGQPNLKLSEVRAWSALPDPIAAA